MWLGFSVQSVYISVRDFLPGWLSSVIEKLMPRDGLTNGQFSKIEQLGKNLGLERADVIAAVDNPIVESGTPTRPRFLMMLNLVIVAVIVITAVILILFIVDPESLAGPTYAPGEYYGTIKPQDFVMM